jgi:hypothetical protein
MPNYPADAEVLPHIETVRAALPDWVVSTVELVELAQNAERVGVHVDPLAVERSQKLIVEVAEWQQRLGEWQALNVSPRMKAELRILKATLDATMDEANAADSELELFDR